MAKKREGDPRQTLFLKYYLDPKSETFSNALQSGLKAGYTQEYSESILQKDLDWLAEGVGSNERLKRAERVLDEMLDMQVQVTKINDDVELTVTDTGLVKIKQDTAKFIASRLGKHKWSERTELTGANGKDLVPVEEVKERLKNL